MKKISGEICGAGHVVDSVNYIKIIWFSLIVSLPGLDLPSPDYLQAETVNRKGIILYDDCENLPTESEWRMDAGGIDPGEFAVSSERARSGSKSYKFILPPYPTAGTGSGGKRTELVRPGTFDYNKDYWFGWSMYLPANFVWPQDMVTNDWASGWQFHRSYDVDSCDTVPGAGHTGSIFFAPEHGKRQLNIMGDPEKCSEGNSGVHYLSPGFPVTVGGWTDYVMHVRWGYNLAENPIMELWANGTKVVDRKGVNCWNDTNKVYLKFGLYAVQHGTPEVPNMIAYYDEIRIGDATSDYASVAPGTSSTPPPSAPRGLTVK